MRDYEHAVTTLYSTQSFGPQLSEALSERKSTVDAMQVYLKRLGLSEAAASLRVLHVTGSKGKGSTCAFAESLIRSVKGLTTVLFTSPHLVKVNERIRLNGSPLSNASFNKYFWELWDALEKAPHQPDAPPVIPGFFRLITLMAVYVAIEEKAAGQADVLILEVGMGGRYDATNLISRPVACAINTLDLEHTAILGDNIDQIAWEKGGICKRGVPVFVVPQEGDQGMAVLRACAQEAEAPLIVVTPLPRLEHLSLGMGDQDCQYMNAALAVALMCAVCGCWPSPSAPPEALVLRGPEAEDVIISVASVVAADAAVQRALAECQWPGRFQAVPWPGPVTSGSRVTFCLDGAHTEKSIRAASSWFESQCRLDDNLGSSGSSSVLRRALVWHCSEEKRPCALLQHLVCAPSPFDLVIFCKPSSGRPTLAKPQSVQQALDEWIATSEEAARYRDNVMACQASILPQVDDMRSDSEPLVWQRTLAALWRVLDCHFNRKVSAADCRRLKVTESVAAAIGEVLTFCGVEAEDCGTVAMKVLVCGSLYLVGDALAAREQAAKNT